ncbi:nuclear transport factor 2 family protein [Sandarakinorhabdus rubra]|uniref:nuclear transport factor 2 family protein n=1 Tax=Sandarakinorhabdus rubra TaxID=2672568 RepID=UPI0013D9A0C3|nr:nuclear transport factor 2 family protein [Sandarakinorhabdus rubra]
MEEIAQALFEALSAGDDDGVRRLCANDFQLRQNGGAPMNLETLLAFNAQVHAVASGFHYANPVRAATPGGFVEEHAVRASLLGGGRIDLAVVVVGQVSDGKVTEAREYFDSAGAAPLVAALSQAR